MRTINIFKENPLLLINSDISRYYHFNKDSNEFHEKSIHFLYKLEEEMVIKSTTKEPHEKNNRYRVQLRLIEEEKRKKDKLK